MRRFSPEQLNKELADAITKSIAAQTEAALARTAGQKAVDALAVAEAKAKALQAQIDDQTFTTDRATTQVRSA